MSTETSIKCPQCGTSIQISEVLGEAIRSQVQQQEQEKYAAKLKELSDQQGEFKQKQKELETERQSLDEVIQERLASELEKQRPELKKLIETENRQQLTDLQNQVTESTNKVTNLEQMEIDLRKLNRELAEANQAKDLEVQRKLDVELQKLTVKLREEQQETVSEKDKAIGNLNNQLKVLKDKEASILKDLSDRSKLIEDREKTLAIEAESFERLVDQRVKTVIESQTPELKNKIESEHRTLVTDLTNQVAEKDRKVTELQNAELELRKKNRELLEASQEKDLEVQRKLDMEREKIVAKQQEEHNVSLAQKDKQIGDLRVQIAELQKRAEQLPQKTQGEAAELRLEEILRHQFPQDNIEPVASGVRGADIVQTVFSPGGVKCGSILWESKDAKNWQEAWIKKAKDDQVEAKADAVIICSSVLPKGIESHDFRSQVWITSHLTALAICATLRQMLVQLNLAVQVQQGKVVKAEIMYEYITGNEFKQRFGIAVDTFVKMGSLLQQEKRTMQRLWGLREADLQRVLENLAKLFGGLQSIAGDSLPVIEALELRVLPDVPGPGETADDN